VRLVKKYTAVKRMMKRASGARVVQLIYNVPREQEKKNARERKRERERE